MYKNYTHRRVKPIIAKIAARIARCVLFLRSLFVSEEADSRRLRFPLRSTGDIKGEIKEILPQRALKDYLYFYNREYKKYGFVKDLKKTIRLMRREEFAHKRALILTLRKLADRPGAQQNKKIRAPEFKV